MKNVASLAVKRVLLAVPILFGVTLISFVFVAFAPQSPAVARLGAVNPDAVAQLEESLGLNRPLHVQYFDWLTGMIQADFGTSLVNGQEVFPLIISKFAVSAQIGIAAFIWMIVMSAILGMLGAFYRNQLPDHVARLYAITGISFPDFIVGMFLILIFGVWFSILPAGGWTPLSEGVIPYIRGLLLPSFTVGFLFTSIVTRMFRSDLLETIESEHVNAAKALGISRQEIILYDIVKPAVIPTLTTVGMATSILLGGLVLTEIVFAIPGMGREAVNAIEAGDFPVIQGFLVFIAAIFVFFNIVVDLMYYYLDPRIGMEGE